MTTICTYPSLAIEGETLRVERTAGRYRLCRLDRHGRRIRCMNMQITPESAAAHVLLARKLGGQVADTALAS